MKILFINRPKSLWIGGDYIQMEKTACELAKLGHSIEVSEKPLITPAIRMRDFDIVHTWNFSMEWSKYAIWAGKRWGKKVVASMIYHESDQFVPWEQQQVMLDNTDACIFLAQGEIERVKRHLKLDETKAHIVPNGIDEFWLQDCVPTFKIKDFVLTVGRIDGTKGQLNVAKLCKKLKVPYVCVGERTNEDLAQQIEKTGAVIMPPMEKEDLIKMYSGCKVLAMASNAEVMSLVVMEAMAQNANIVLTERSEWKPTGVSYCNPDDIDSIEKALRVELLRPKDLNKYKQVANLKWSDVAKQINKIYESINPSSSL